jgi:hypothetical protein
MAKMECTRVSKELQNEALVTLCKYKSLICGMLRLHSTALDKFTHQMTVDFLNNCFMIPNFRLESQKDLVVSAKFLTTSRNVDTVKRRYGRARNAGEPKVLRRRPCHRRRPRQPPCLHVVVVVVGGGGHFAPRRRRQVQRGWRDLRHPDRWFRQGGQLFGQSRQCHPGWFWSGGVVLEKAIVNASLAGFIRVL